MVRYDFEVSDHFGWEIAEIPVVCQEKKFFWSGKRYGTPAALPLGVQCVELAFSTLLCPRAIALVVPPALS
jgi:hypothetical protein